MFTDRADQIPPAQSRRPAELLDVLQSMPACTLQQLCFKLVILSASCDLISLLFYATNLQSAAFNLKAPPS